MLNMIQVMHQETLQERERYRRQEEGQLSYIDSLEERIVHLEDILSRWQRRRVSHVY